MGHGVHVSAACHFFCGRVLRWTRPTKKTRCSPCRRSSCRACARLLTQRIAYYIVRTIAFAESSCSILPPCVATLAGLFYARVQGPLPAPRLPGTSVCKTSLGFFCNAWRPRLAFLYAGVQGPLPVLRLLVTRCIFQCFCVYLLGSDFDFRDCWSRLRLSRRSLYTDTARAGRACYHG